MGRLQGVDDLRDGDSGDADGQAADEGGDAGYFPPCEFIHALLLLRLRLAEGQRHPTRLLLADRGGDGERLTHLRHLPFHNLSVDLLWVSIYRLGRMIWMVDRFTVQIHPD